MGNLLNKVVDQILSPVMEPIGALEIDIEDIVRDLNTSYGDAVVYQKRYDAEINNILKVTADETLTPIGGGSVQISLLKAQSLASQAKWSQALVPSR